MKQLYEEKIDFRTLAALRDKLFESPNKNNDLMSIEEYQSIKQLCVADKLSFVDQLLLDEI